MKRTIKKLTVLSLCAALALTISACGNAPEAKAETTAANVQTANPFITCNTIDEAKDNAGFSITIPEEIPDGYTETVIRAIKDQMIEIIYSGADQKLTIRKAPGDQDISGDFNTYTENNLITVKDLSVNLKGSDGKVNIAWWTDGDYAFSISVNPGAQGMDSAAITGMIEQIQ